MTLLKKFTKEIADNKNLSKLAWKNISERIQVGNRIVIKITTSGKSIWIWRKKLKLKQKQKGDLKRLWLIDTYFASKCSCTSKELVELLNLFIGDTKTSTTHDDIKRHYELNILGQLHDDALARASQFTVSKKGVICIDFHKFLRAEVTIVEESENTKYICKDKWTIDGEKINKTSTVTLEELISRFCIISKRAKEFEQEESKK